MRAAASVERGARRSRRNSTGSRVFIAHQLQLPGFQIPQQGPRITAPGRIVGRELLASLVRFSLREPLAQELSGEGGAGFSRPFGVPIEATERVFIQCQIEPRHDTDDSTKLGFALSATFV